MLKKIVDKEEKLITKFIAFALIVTLTIANFLLVGKETYAIFEEGTQLAEEIQVNENDVEIFNSVEKYFKIDGIGTLVQFDLDVNMKDNKAFKPQIEVQLPKIKDMIPEKEENVYLIYETLGYIPVYENEYELEAGILTIKPKDITNSYK